MLPVFRKLLLVGSTCASYMTTMPQTHSTMSSLSLRSKQTTTAQPGEDGRTRHKERHRHCPNFPPNPYCYMLRANVGRRTPASGLVAGGAKKSEIKGRRFFGSNRMISVVMCESERLRTKEASIFFLRHAPKSFQKRQKSAHLTWNL